MRDIVGLLVFVCLTIITIYLAVTKQIDWKLTTAFLIFTIFSSFVIVKYEDIKKFKWGNVELETAKKEIADLKDSAVKEIKGEVEEQKESIKLLISNANETKEKIEKQKEVLNDLIETAKKLQKYIDDQTKTIKKLNESAENTKADIERLSLASNKTALLIVKATYLSMETKSEFGTQRAKKATQEVLDDLNKLLPIAIPDERERAEWVKELQSILPPRR